MGTFGREWGAKRDDNAFLGLRARLETLWKRAKLAWSVRIWWRALRSVPMSSAKAREVASLRDCLRRRKNGSTAMTKTVPEAGQP